MLLALVGCSGNTTEGEPQADSMPGLPKQTLLTSSMRQQPGPGWTVTVGELGLPPGTVVRPVDNIGDRGIFIGITGEGWWLLGLDVNSGQRVFGPVRLGSAGDATDFNCYVNGPPLVLCVRQGPNLSVPSTAWVVDTSTGKVTFDGPTDLRIAGTQDQPRIEHVGDYVIAGVTGKGMYGVGSRGELTWFVPGNGILPAQFTVEQRDSVPSTLAVQGSGRVDDVVFSVVDGKVVKPEVPEEIQLGQAVIYPGGIGYEYTSSGDLSERVAFFDNTGKKLSEPSSGGTLETRSLDLPIVASESKNLVMTVDGRQLLELAPSGPSADARLIGSRFFIATDPDHREWQQFDLRTGDQGKTCVGEDLWTYYIASDGDVVVALDEGDGLVRGVDLTTCDVLWTISGSAPNEAKEVWKVHTSLIQRTDDKLFSLVSPK
ncbi:hypothetical protein [Mycobacterium hubeiense]|uniref:hypothetical protein n=1 Tax=Mycobacterium hubeiense TaxID=1867256 RepID=UPI001E5A3C52|nr:hypothetical protein [Mycobacterium sp. QGD 101]